MLGDVNTPSSDNRNIYDKSLGSVGGFMYDTKPRACHASPTRYSDGAECKQWRNQLLTRLMEGFVSWAHGAQLSQQQQ